MSLAPVQIEPEKVYTQANRTTEPPIRQLNECFTHPQMFRNEQGAAYAT